MDKDKNNPQKIKIEIDEKIGEGIYANFAVVTHSLAEFILDFIRVLPGAMKHKVKSRIILTPQHAKRLMNALNENVTKFEGQHGQIKDLDSSNNVPINFGGPTAQA